MTAPNGWLMPGRHSVPGAPEGAPPGGPYGAEPLREAPPEPVARPGDRAPAAGHATRSVTGGGRPARRLRTVLAGVVPVLLAASLAAAVGTGPLGGNAPAGQRTGLSVPVPTFAGGPPAASSEGATDGGAMEVSPDLRTQPPAMAESRETAAAGAAGDAARAAAVRVADERAVAQERAQEARRAEQRAAAQRADQQRADQQRADQQRAAEERAAQERRDRERAEQRARQAPAPSAPPPAGTPAAPAGPPPPPAGGTPDGTGPGAPPRPSPAAEGAV
ncbi:MULTISPECIES: hypothetical protein [unclassified Pseudonocardia]|uniref:hypothetical protein n=1 Tax=unclassified Pseudonocardia TaxID=2619320 RepID=UPI00094B0E79|nr:MULTISPECIES: hypothetical protein [unclassified Pseudonocardia]